MTMLGALLVGIATWVLPRVRGVTYRGAYLPAISPDFRLAADGGNYSCDELIRWIATEKHYSNDKKKVLFQILAEQSKQRACEARPYVSLAHVSFGVSASNSKTFFVNGVSGTSTKRSVQQCSNHDNTAVAFLSNFSINNNFSHFLHALVRLFCALIDARLLHWDAVASRFNQSRPFTLWLDENLKLSAEKETWLRSFGAPLRSLRSTADCVSSDELIYGSGCVRLLPPEKWFGYPGCRAGEVLRAFGAFMRSQYMAPGPDALRFVDDLGPHDMGSGLRIAFAVRDVGTLTGRRQVSNLQQVQALIRKTQHVRSSMENVTFEHLDVPSTVRYMAGVHVFVSVHGAGMTNMFFMNPGAAVVEIIPYPLCSCRSPDYFYGVGGYYHGSAIAQGLKHYHFCVSAPEVQWHKKPEELRSGGKCSWKHLHAVESVFVDPARFVSLMRNVERDLVAQGTIVLTKPIISVSPHANG